MANDLFDFFDAANRGNHEFVDTLSDDQVKKIAPYVLLMWANGATRNTAEHVLYTNMVMNPYVFSLSTRPRLLLSLFIAANEDEDNPRYQFRKYGMTKESSDVQLIAQHYKCGTITAKQYHSMMSEEDLEELNSIYGNEPKGKKRKK